MPEAPFPARSSTFGEAALEELRFPGPGERLVAWDLPGRSQAALVIAFPGIRAGERPGEAGPAALALALLAAEIVGGKEGGDPAALEARLVDLGGESLGILIEGRARELGPLAGIVPPKVGQPAFLAEGFADEAFQDSLRALRLAERRRGLGGPAAPSGLGSEAGLRSLDLKAVRAYWRAYGQPEGTRFAAVGDLDPGPLSAALGEGPAGAGAEVRPPTKTALPASASRPSPAGAASPKVAGPPVLELPPSLLVEADRGTMAVLVELLGLATKSGPGRGAWSWTPEGRGLRIEALSGSGPPTGLAGLGRAAGDLAARGIDEASLRLARSRALARLFDGEVPRLVAVAMARDLVSGGDGRGPFVLASEIERSGAEGLRRAAALLAGLHPGFPDP